MCFVLSVQACSVFSVKSLGYGSITKPQELTLLWTMQADLMWMA